MIEMKFSKNDEEDGLFRISSRDIVGFYNCSSKQERKITDIIKCYGTTKSIKEVELKNMKPEDNVTVSRYIECKLCLNGMPVPLLRNCYSIFNGTKYR